MHEGLSVKALELAEADYKRLGRRYTAEQVAVKAAQIMRAFKAELSIPIKKK